MTTIDSLPTIGIAEALERFELGRHFSRYEGEEERRRARGAVRFHEDDLALDGDLELDWERVGEGIAGIVVTGDLSVRGSVLNLNGDGGPFLLVLGHLRARNVVAGGSEIRVLSGARVDELVIGYYNHGRLHIDGETTAGLVLSFDHDSDITTRSPYWNDFDYPVGMPLSDYLHADVEVERDEESYAVPFEKVDDDVLVRRILDGLPVLRAPDDTRPQRSIDTWRTQIAAMPDVIRYAPEDALDEELCAGAVARNGRLIRHLPERLRTEAVCAAAFAEDMDMIRELPVPLRTPERCRAAVDWKGRNIEHVPLELRTRELCELAVVSDFATTAVRFIPDDILDEELCLMAIRADVTHMRDIPPEKRTRAVCIEAVRADAWAAQFVPEPMRATVLDEAGVSEGDTRRRSTHGTVRVPDFRMPKLPSKSEIFFRMIFHSMDDEDGPWPGGVVGWFARRPMFTVLLRGIVSVPMLAVHIWLTVHAWTTAGWLAGVLTFLVAYASELYWAWRITTTTGVDALAVSAVLSVVLYLSIAWIGKRAGAVWQAREQANVDEDPGEGDPSA